MSAALAFVPTTEADDHGVDDTLLVRRILASSDGRRFHQLFIAGEGRPGRAPSDAEFDLAALLTRHSPDNAQCARVLLQSALVQAWDVDTRRRRDAFVNPLAPGKRGHGAYCLATVDTVRAMQPDASSSPTGRWRLFTADELLALPEPPWLVHDVLFAGGFTLLYGMKGTFKSFVAHSLAETIGRGAAWLGTRTVNQGTVVYVVAEGKGYFGRRIRAMGPCAGVRYVTVPVNLFTGEATDFAEAVRAQLGDARPSLFVFDTLARSMVGGEENSNSDMMVVVDAAQRLQHDFDAAVLLVHHTGKDGLSERGGSALRAAADIVVKLEKTGPLTVNLLFENTKDLAEPTPVGLTLVEREQSLVVTLGEVHASAASARQETPEERCTRLVTLCAEPKTKDQLAQLTARPPRTLERELRALVRDGRLKVSSGEGTRGSPFAYVTAVAPIDTV